MNKQFDWVDAPHTAEAYQPGGNGLMEAWYRKDSGGQVHIFPLEGPKNTQTWTWMGGRTDFPPGAILRPEGAGKIEYTKTAASCIDREAERLYLQVYNTKYGRAWSAIPDDMKDRYRRAISAGWTKIEYKDQRTGGPAMSTKQVGQTSITESGKTVLDGMAMEILKELIRGATHPKLLDNTDQLAQLAYQQARAMMKERGK